MTRNPRLLIIDDDLDQRPNGAETRRSQYEKLGDHFAISFLQSPAELHEALESRRFDAVLVDFVLTNWDTDSAWIIQQVRDSVPVALISQSWSANLGALSNTISAFPIARLFTWEDMATSRTREIVAFWIKAAIRERFGNLAVDYAPDEPLRIVHFSDMQFNANNGKVFETDTQVAIQEIQAKWDKPPHFVALTGDIAEAGRPAEYEMAQRWVEGLRKKLGRGRFQPEILTVPGNHDVCWPLALSQRVDAKNKNISADDPLCPDLAPYAFAPYREFSSKVEPPLRWSGINAHWISHAYRQAGVILFGLNSSEDMDTWGKPSQRLPDATIARLFSDICDLRQHHPNALVIGLMHHPLEGSEEAIVNSSDFKLNISAATGSVVLLTGHVHENATELKAAGNKPGILQVGSSTFTQGSARRPEDSLRGFNLIEIQRQFDKVVGLQVQTYAIMGHQLRMQSVDSYKFAGGRLRQFEDEF